MKTLQIKEETAKEIFPDAPVGLKKMLIETFGKSTFLAKITDRVKTFEDALNEVGETLEEFEARTKKDTIDEKAYKQVKIIALALNEGVIMDGTDTSQYKYYPWHEVKGGGLAYGDCGGWGTATGVGSRLCFKSAELAKYAGTQFLDIYENLKIK